MIPTRWLFVAPLALAALVVLTGHAAATTPVSGEIANDTVWSLARSPYLVTGNVTVDGFNGADGVTTLTIEPGVVVQFMPHTRLQIGGCCSTPGGLLANGTADAPILFTSAAASPAPGDWNGIFFNGTADDAYSFVQNDIIEYAGGDGSGLIRVSDASPTIASDVLRNSAAFGVYGEGEWAAPIVSGDTFVSNGAEPVRTSPWGAGNVARNDYSANGAERSILVYGQRVEANARWDDPGTPYHIDGAIVVAGDEAPHLTIGPGVQVNMSAGARIEAGMCCDYSGGFSTEGTADEPVLFTSHQPQGAKTNGFWDRVYYYDASYAYGPTLLNTTFEYGGSSGRGMVEMSNVSADIHGGSFLHSAGFGVVTHGYSYPVIEGATFADNAQADANLQADGVRLAQGNTFPSGGEIRVEPGTLWHDAVWADQGVRYNATGNLTISGNDGPDFRTSLDLLDNVTITFSRYASLTSQPCYYCSYSGYLNASGTTDRPVTLTSVDTVKAPGQWGGVSLGQYSSAGHLTNLTIAYAGSITQGALMLQTAAPTLENVTVLRSGSHGLYLYCPVSPTLTDVDINGSALYGLYEDNYYSTCGPSFTRVTIEGSGQRPARLDMLASRAGLTFVNNGIPEIEVYQNSGTLLSSAELDLRSDRDTGAPYAYAILSSITVENDSTLTIDPGVRLLWAPYTSLNVGTCCGASPFYRGTLVAHGTTDLPIVFDASNVSNEWYGVFLEGYGLNPDPNHDLANVTFAHSRDDGLDMRRVANGMYDNVTVRDNTRYGLYLEDASTTTWNDLNAIHNGNVGVYLYGTHATLQGGLIDGNVGYGIYTYNWQGAGATVNGTAFRNQTGRPALVRLDDLFIPGELTANSIPDVQLINFDISSSVHIRRIVGSQGETYTYSMLGGFTVSNNATLTLDPGVKLLWPNGAYLNVGICCSNGAAYMGTLVAHGTTDLPIVMDAVDPANSWYGVFLEGYGLVPDAPFDLANVTIAHSRDDGLQLRRVSAGAYDNVTLRDNARFGLYLNDNSNTNWTSLTVVNNSNHGVYEDSSTSAVFYQPTFRANLGQGIYLSSSNERAALYAPTFDSQPGIQARLRLEDPFVSPTFTHGGTHQIEIWGVTMVQNATLSLYNDAVDGLPYSYAMVQHTYVRNNATLTIAPGVTIYADYNIGFSVGACCNGGTTYRGALIAQGTTAQPIRFLNRSSFVTNGWWGIAIDGDTTTPGRLNSSFANVTLTGSLGNEIYVIRHAGVTFDNVTTTDSKQAGIELDTSAVATLQSFTSQRNPYDLYVRDNGNATVIDGLLTDASIHGILLEHDSTQAYLTNVTIRNTTQYGLYGGGGWGGTAYFTHVTIQNTTGRPWRLSPWSDTRDVVLSGNNVTDLEWLRGDVADNRTWRSLTDAATGAPYTYTARDGVRFYNNGTLTIEPGVTVRFAQNAWMDIGWCCYNPATKNRAALDAEGTAAAPIRFTSLTGNRSTGWYGLLLQGDGIAPDMPSILRNMTIEGSLDDSLQVNYHDNTTLDNVTLRDATRFGLYVSNQYGPTARNLLVEDTANHGIYTDGSAVMDLVGGTVRRTAGYGVYQSNANFAGRYQNLDVENTTSPPLRVRLDTDLTNLRLATDNGTVEMYGVDLSNDRTLPLAADPVNGTSYPLLILNTFNVKNGSRLTIPAGSTILLAQDQRIQVGICCNQNSLDPGGLTAIGTTQQPIVFGSQTWNKSTGWRGLYFDGRSNYGEMTSVIKNATVRDSKADNAEVLGQGNVTFDRVTFLNATNSGLWTHGTGTQALNNDTFLGGQWGLFTQDVPLTIRDNAFANQTVNALYMERAHFSNVTSNNLSAFNATVVRLVDTDNSFFRGNAITDGATGVRVESTSTNDLFTNNRLLNVLNANDSATNTRWNDTKTAGANVCGGLFLAGNCWSDYLGIDNTGDGIGDTLLPYKVGITGPGDLAPMVVRPTANFNGTIVNVTAGIVNFTDHSTDPLYPIVNWSWSFGDGGVAWDQNPTHTYAYEGLFTAQLTIRDTSGATATANRTILLDTLPPTSTGQLSGLVGDAGWWVSNVTVSLNATDNQSSVTQILYRVGGIGNFTPYGNPIVLANDGVTRVEYFAIDLAGNNETIRHVDVAIDQTMAQTNTTLSGTLHAAGWYTANVTAALVSFDATSGVNLTFYRLDAGDVAIFTNGTPILVNGTGIHTLAPFAKDLAGNLATAVNVSIPIDITPPTSTIVVTNGTAGNASWWRSAVDVGLNATDPGAGVQAVQIGIDGSPLIPYTAPIHVATEGIHHVGHQATDLVDHVEALTDSLVKIDLTNPSLTVDLAGTQHPSGWYTTTVTAFANATDATSGVATIEKALDSPGFTAYTAPVSIATTGTHTLTARATDIAGNLVTGLTQTIKVDVTAPSTSSSVITGTHGTGSWYRSDVTDRLTASDGAGSGVTGITYSLDNGTSLPFVSDISITGEGIHLIRAAASDVVGHVEALKTFQVGIDLTAPSTLVNATGQQNPDTLSYYGPVRIQLLPSDGLSGILNTKYWINGAGPTTYGSPFMLNTAGVYNLTYQATDLAGNVEPLKFLNLTLDFDLTPPVSTASLTGVAGTAPWYRSPVNVTLAATDAGAGVDLIEYRLSNASNWTVYTGAFTVADEGSHTLQFQALDLVGNLETAKLVTFGVDTSAPVLSYHVTGLTGENGWYAGPVNLTLGAVDAVSSVRSLTYSVNGGASRAVTGVIPFNTSGVYDLSWVAVDLGGNLAQRNLTLKLDLDAPTAVSNVTGVAGNDSAWWRSAITVTLNASDPTSGVLRIDYSLDGGAFVPYVGPFNLSTEGNHTLDYQALDITGNRGILYHLVMNIDLTTPIVNLTLDEDLLAQVNGTIVLRDRICVHTDGLDALSGLNTLMLHVVGVVERFIALDIGVNYHCVELPDGPYTIELIGCDKAGWCATGSFHFIIDNGPPDLWLVRPTPGSVMVQNVSAPIFRTLFGHNRTAFYAEAAGLPTASWTPPGWPDGAPIEDPRDDHGWLKDAPLSDPRRDPGALNVTLISRNDSLARTTIVVGPRVPIWIAAWDASGVANVEFDLDGAPVGHATQPQHMNITTFGVEERNVLDPNGPFELHAHDYNVDVYVVTIDTLGMIAGSHNVTVKATDILGSESERTFSFLFESGQNAENIGDQLEAAVRTVETPQEANATRDWMISNVKFFAPIVDQELARNYAFFDEGLLEFEHVYDPIVAAPGLAYADEGWSI